jgi:hypothetical protein
MAKRFTDSMKYKKKFFRELPGSYKLLWDFLYHDCDNCGIWIVDFDLAQKYVGKDMLITEEEALKLFNADEVRIVKIDKGEKWFLPGYIEFQYGQLSEKNRAHIPVITALKKYDLINPDYSLKEKIKGDTSPLQGAKDKAKEKEKDKDMDKEKDKDNSPDEKFVIPAMCRRWYEIFPLYTSDKENDYEAMKKISAFMMRQAGEHDVGNLQTQEKIINTLVQISEQVIADQFWVNKPLKSIANHIQEFYNKIKNPINGKDHTGEAGGKSIRSDVQAELEKRRAKREQTGA